jgi:hypothetical protein
MEDVQRIRRFLRLMSIGRPLDEHLPALDLGWMAGRDRSQLALIDDVNDLEDGVTRALTVLGLYSPERGAWLSTYVRSQVSDWPERPLVRTWRSILWALMYRRTGLDIPDDLASALEASQKVLGELLPEGMLLGELNRFEDQLLLEGHDESDVEFKVMMLDLLLERRRFERLWALIERDWSVYTIRRLRDWAVAAAPDMRTYYNLDAWNGQLPYPRESLTFIASL